MTRPVQLPETAYADARRDKPAVHRTLQVASGLLLDLSADGRLIGVERIGPATAAWTEWEAVAAMLQTRDRRRPRPRALVSKLTEGVAI